jgi:hypothetical protein
MALFHARRARSLHLLRAVILLVLAGCADWVPVHNAADIPQGHALKVPTASGQVVVSHLVTCDRAGVILARSTEDCVAGATFDVRRTEVLVHKMLLSTGATLTAAVMAALLTVAIFVIAGT